MNALWSKGLHYKQIGSCWVNMGRRGFSLLELSIVLLISGLMMSFVFNASQLPNNPAASGECVNITKAQLNYIRSQIEIFARKNDRLPTPARRDVGPTSTVYGREAVAANLTVVGAAGPNQVMYGALPFQALGLPLVYAADCWGNKYTYAVNTSLTTSAASGGYLDSTINGTMTLKSSATNTTSTTGAYAVISHGPDGLGAVKAGYSTAGAPGWCSGSTNIAYTNCLATGTTLMDAKYNDGQDAGANYFDDIVIAGVMKPQILASTPSNAYCWGANTYGGVGDGTTTTRANATNVQLPSGQTFFASISNGGDTSCALTGTGLPYCWGLGTSGQIGNGANSSKTSPTAVTLPTGATYFTRITNGYNHVCGVGDNAKAYCWGHNGYGSLGDSSNTNRNVPTLVTLPGGVTSFSKMSAGVGYTCAIANTGNAYCWGLNTTGQLGNGAAPANSNSPQLITKPGGVSSFGKISASSSHTCALANTGDAYCWGDNTYGQIGDGTTTTRPSPTLVSKPGGVAFFYDIAAASQFTCAIANTGDAYCWGSNYYGSIGDGTNVDKLTATLVTKPSGVTKFVTIKSHTDAGTVCAMADDFNTYCWGENDANQIGDGTTVDKNVPTKVVQASNVVAVGGGIGGGRCALKPLPYAGWNGYSDATTLQIIGNGVSAKASTPQWGWTSSTTQPDNYFKYISGYLQRCGITDSGAIYCWGYNGNGQLGDGTTTNRFSAPVRATFPAGVTAWKMINTSNYGSNYAVADGGANDGRLYIWGHPAPAWATVPTLYANACTGSKVTALYGQQSHMYGICQNGKITDLGGSGTGIPGFGTGTNALPASPAGITSVTSLAKSYYQVCILADSSIDGNGQIYCHAAANSYNVVGDGSAAGTTTAALTRVTLPAGVTKFTALATASSMNDGSGSFCGLADDNWIYCWGVGYATGTNQASNSTAVLVPTAVTAPTGVSKFVNLQSAGFGYYLTAMGNDGQTYTWGQYYYDNDWPGGWSVYYKVPTLAPLPKGATGMRNVGAVGGQAELYY